MLPKSKLITLCVVSLCSVILILAQTRDEFRQRYGAPENGAYTVRSGIVMTVLYSEENQAHEFKIAPQSSLQKENSETQAETMSLETASEIIDEVMPLSQRGKSIREYNFSAGCTSTETSEYEKVSIHRALRCSESGINRVTFVQIKKK